MTKVHSLAIGFLTIVSLSFGQAVSRQEYLTGFEQRARYIVSAFDTAGGYNGVAARYARGGDLRAADSIFVAMLKVPQGDMFWMYPVIGAYMYGKDRMSPATKAVVRNAWKTYAPYRGDTENHWAMYHASLYIAAEQWPNLPGSEWFNGKSSDENRIDAGDYLIHWIKITTTIGQGEFDSPDYFPEYANAMTLLADFAQDPAMKQRGKMMLDYLYADFAAEHLAGQYLGGYSRIYQPAVFKPLNSGASAFAYLYFGTGDPVQSGWTVLSALGSYPAFGEVVGRHFDGHEIAREDADVVFAHLAGDMRGDYVPVLELHAERSVGQSLDDFAFHLQCFFFCHSPTPDHGGANCA